MKSIKRLVLFTVVSAMVLSSLPSLVHAQDKGSAFGFTGGYYMSMLWNEDDHKADARLDYATTLKYGGGVEYMGWLNTHFGIGIQGAYCFKGQDYKGYDEATKLRLNFKTELPFAQISLLAYHRSYNRYNPQARFRFTSYFGPYFGFLPAYRDQSWAYLPDGKLLATTYLDQNSVRNGLNDTAYFKFKRPIYKNFDVGFVVAPGFEVMITPRTAITFNIRADIGARQIENRTNQAKIISKPPYEEPFSFWDNLYAKYWTAPASTLPDEIKQYQERARTTTFTAGAWLGLRFYNYARYVRSRRNK